ncbi:tRNA (adenosine(37)-N6)-dimethylallyltransferase MiaA [Eubacteriales bacterium OttesenSCG-928-M02]|nr:tRNA (adenosine(37)-N6)-dimethylallyltransferase MiaA [Eubacteriales bacterium OttesenSCG-928-M02]
MKKAIYIVGPTATGKSKLAVALAKKLDGEVVNMDSMQVYRQLSIGAAKPTQEEMEGIPHHLFGIVDVGEEFSVSRYRDRAEAVMEEICERERVPIFCGGTGLYLNAMIYEMDFTQANRDDEVRKRLEKQLEAEGKGALYARLMEVDAETAERLNPNDVRRVMRALEVYEITGLPMSAQTGDFQGLRKKEYPFVLIGLTDDRERLYHRINQRVEEMLEKGLIEEARDVLSLGVAMDHPSMMGIGYRQVFPYLQGEYGYEEMVALIKQETRRFCKRQITWLKREGDIHWLSLTEDPSPKGLAEEVLAILEEEDFI